MYIIIWYWFCSHWNKWMFRK